MQKEVVHGFSSRSSVKFLGSTEFPKGSPVCGVRMSKQKCVFHLLKLIFDTVQAFTAIFPSMELSCAWGIEGRGKNVFINYFS